MRLNRITRIATIISLSGLLVLTPRATRAQDTNITVQATPNYFSPEKNDPLTLGVQVSNSTSGNIPVDAYLGFIFPGGDIFCFNNPGNLNSIAACGTAKDLQLAPFISSAALPAGLNYRNDNFFSTAPTALVSLGLPAGNYQAFGLLTHPGSLEVLSFSTADFTIAYEPSGGDGTLNSARTIYAVFKGNHTLRDNIKNKDITEERELWVTNASTTQETHPLAWNSNGFSASYTENISSRTSQTISISGEISPAGDMVKTAELKRRLSGRCLSGEGSNDEITEYVLSDIPLSKTTEKAWRFEIAGEAAQKRIANIAYKEHSDCLNIDNEYISTDWQDAQVVIVFYK